MQSRIFPLFAMTIFALIWFRLVIGQDYPFLQTAIPGNPNDDAFHGIYLHHMVHDAIAQGRYDLHDPSQLHPVGYHPAATNGGNYIEMVISYLLRFFFPWPTWYSFSHYIWIPINFLSFLPLGYHLWRKWSISFSIAAVWSILPFTLSFIAYGRLTQAVQCFIPLCILGFVLITEKRNWRSALLLGVAMGLCAWSYWFFAIFLTVLGIVFLAKGLRAWNPSGLLLHLVIAITMAFLLMLPLILLVFAPTLQGGQQPSSPVSTFSISPIFPDALRLFGEGTQLWSLFPICIWVLLPIGILRGKRRLLWSTLAILCVLFSIGPAILYNNLVWKLPYYPIWKNIPLLDRLLHPERWMLVGGIFFCILAGEGGAFLLRKTTRLRPIFSLLLFTVPFATLYELQQKKVLPLGYWSFHHPEIWSEAAKSQGALIVIPIMNSQLSTRYQPFHKKNMLGGMVENQPWNYPADFVSFVEKNGLLMDLYSLHQHQIKPFTIYQDDIDDLRNAGFRTLIFDKASWDRLGFHKRSNGIDKQNPIPILIRAFGQPDYQNEQGDAMWELPNTGSPGRSPKAGSSIRAIGPGDPVPEGAPPL